MADYDIITIGGGIGGASLAKEMAERGHKVLVVERETSFKDRVRGEWMAPWGVAEAVELGVFDTIMDAGGHQPPNMVTFAGPAPLPPRKFAETTPQGLNHLTAYHPKMQEALLQSAEAAGAEVRRDAKVRSAEPGAEPRVEIEWNGGTETKTARLVVGCDGRNSVARKWGGFQAQQDRCGNYLGGVLVENMNDPGEDTTLVFNPIFGQGMTVAALEAEWLGKCLDKTNPSTDGFAKTYYGGVKLIVDLAWGLPDLESKRNAAATQPWGTRFLLWYTERMQNAASRSAHVSKTIAHVQNMIEPPAALFKPSVFVRVLFA